MQVNFKHVLILQNLVQGWKVALKGSSLVSHSRPQHQSVHITVSMDAVFGHALACHPSFTPHKLSECSTGILVFIKSFLYYFLPKNIFFSSIPRVAIEALSIAGWYTSLIPVLGGRGR